MSYIRWQRLEIWEGRNETSPYLQLHKYFYELIDQLSFLGESDHFLFNNLQTEEVKYKLNGQSSNNMNTLPVNLIKKVEMSNKDQARYEVAFF